ncbi:adenylate/guanylate cyclase domain-containing protein [Variovorax rhizosphaerae]|uniref:Adenylate/guanylate cyclase domain-containing protein n=1 Tax=Variovorax rhizosphaerae TaxID=1836200 RepID=A0ABU8WD44_9BURK
MPVESQPALPLRLRRFRVDVGTIITVVILVESLLLIALGYWGSQRLVSRIGESAHQADHLRIEDRTIAFLHHAATAVRAMSESPSLQTGGEGTGQSGELIWTLLQQSPELDSIYVAAADGRMLMVTRHPEPAVVNMKAEPQGTTEVWHYKPPASDSTDVQERFRTVRVETLHTQYKPAERDWFRSALNSQRNEAVWSQPYVFASQRQELGVTYSLPAWRRGADGSTQQLVAAGDVTLGRLSEFVRLFSRDGNGEAALLGTAFQVLARSDVEGNVRQLDVPRGGVLGAVHARLQAGTGARGAADGNFALEHEGRRYLVRTSHLPSTNWLLVSWVPEDTLLGGLRRNVLWLLALVLSSLGIILIVSLRLSKVVTLPVEQLSRIARRIGRFDLDNIPRVPSRVLEIQQLDQALDDSARGLKAFRKFVPVDLVNQLVDEGHTLTPSGEPRRITAMFTDVAGFTRISEVIETKMLVEQLTEYFNVATRVIARHGGTVDKFIGDAIMVLWGAPSALEDAEYKACVAALDLQAELAALNARWATQGRQAFVTRIGIHTGTAVVGALGSNDRLAYTAFGDAINVASRIEGMNKELGTKVLLSESTFEGLKGRLRTRRVEEVALRGRLSKMVLYELLPT